MHNSNLHDWGIASGLEVSVEGGTQIIVNPGVAIDSDGQLISLAIKGKGKIENQPGDNREVDVPVKLSTANYVKKTVYVTIQFSESPRDGGVAGKLEQVPWIRLQPVDTLSSSDKKLIDDGMLLVLAIAEIDENGKLQELKAADSTLLYRRRLIGESIEELRIQRSSKIGDEVQDMPSGKIGPGDAGGLKITVPGEDSILFAREDGSNFKNLEIHADVGIGTTNSSAKLEVNGDIKGNGNLIINGNVGIGTIEPEPKSALNVSKTNTDAVIRAQTATSGNSSLSLLNNGNQEYQIVANRASNHLEITRPGTVGVMMAFDPNNGNVGVGTTSPSAKLEVNGDIKGNANLIINGNVGIGTSEPKSTLNVSKADTDAVIRAQTVNSGNSLLSLLNDGNQEYQIVANRVSNHLEITRPGIVGVMMAFDPNNGNVGIGTTNPSDKLNVDPKGQGGIVIGNPSTGSGGYTSLIMEISAESNGYSSLQSIRKSGSEWGDISLNPFAGNVGIGTTIPRAKLDVQGDIRINDQNLWLRGDTDNNHGIGWYGNKPFAGIMVDGPTIFGYSGGALGTTLNGQKIALQWDSAGNVITHGSHTYLTGTTFEGGFRNIEAHHVIGPRGFEALSFEISYEGGGNLLAKSVVISDDWGFYSRQKHFLIKHPLDLEHKYLVHSTLEGPEAAVFYRGEAKLSNGEATVTLPDYFEALTRKENRTVLLTPKFEEGVQVSMLAASEVKDGKFTVKMIDSNNPSQKFYWEVKAIRADVEKLEVEMTKIPV